MSNEFAKNIAPISAVVLNYNYGQFLADAIDSLLNQELPFQRVIVVNNGSTDDSMDVVRRYGDRITCIDIKMNRGHLGAAIAGLELVTSEYVYFLDADDFADLNLTKQLLPYFQTNPVKIQFQLKGVDANKQSLSSVFPAYPPGYNAKRMRLDNQIVGFYICATTTGSVYQVTALRNLQLSRLNYRDDYMDGTPSLVMPYIGEVLSVPLVLANYRIHGANESQYFNPTPELLTTEIDMLHRRWCEAAMLLPNIFIPPPIGSTLFEIERLLVSGALKEGAQLILVFRYIRSLWRTSEVIRRKILLSIWAFSILVLPRELRRRIIFAKRSSLNRSKQVRYILRFLLGTRNYN